MGLSPEEVELYFSAGVWVTASDLSRGEKQKALAEGRALGMSSQVGDFASGDASLVPLDAGDSLSKIKVVVPPGEVATQCFSADREHEVWSQFYDAQIRDACDGLTPEATERVREVSRGLAAELARLLPAEVAEPLLEPWSRPEARAETYAARIFELVRVAAQIPNPPPRLGERLRHDAQRMFVGLACRAKLGRDVEPVSFAQSPMFRELVARRAADPLPAANAPGVQLKIGLRVLKLIAHKRQEIADTETPFEIWAVIRCDACATVANYIAPVKYAYHDDDHYGRLELGYESPVDSGCMTCGAGIVVKLGYTLTEVTGVTPHRNFIELDAVEEKMGKLCPPELV